MKDLNPSLLNLFFPTANACHLCQRALTGMERCLCSQCAADLQDWALPEESRETLVLSRWRAMCAFPYGEQARELVRLLKYQGDLEAAEPLGEQMALVLAQSGLKVDMLLPVPMHPVRLKQRGYNQAEQLAHQISSHTGLFLCTDGLIRVGGQQTQVHRNRAERLTAMKDAFRAEGKIVRGRRLLLIDDVLTTGATAGACAKALIDAGASRVTILTACRA